MAKQEQKKPNILVIWGDDIGITNVQGISAAPEGGQFHHRSSTGEDERSRQRQTLRASEEKGGLFRRKERLL
jgi:hypothetical protein